MHVDWNSILNTAITATIIGLFTSISQFFAIRYVAKIAEHVEKKVKVNGKKNGES